MGRDLAAVEEGKGKQQANDQYAGLGKVIGFIIGKVAPKASPKSTPKAPPQASPKSTPKANPKADPNQKAKIDPSVDKMNPKDLPLPKNMTPAEFGKNVVGWGKGPKGAVDAKKGLNQEVVDNMKTKGLTKDMVDQWSKHYTNEVARTANPAAAARADLMNSILGYFD
jgi:hypothetical protein